MAVDEARERLSRLGIFKSVDVTFDPPTGDPRNVVFDLQEGKRIDVSLLGGYGSYDQLFGGIEVRQANLWGIGHFGRLELMQSFKTAQGSYTYTVPEFPADDASVYLSGRGLDRQEPSFHRRELSTIVGIRKTFPGAGHQLGLRYAYEFLNASAEPDPYPTQTDFRATSVGFDWQWERRDNSLLPRRGFSAGLASEVALPELGGNANYARIFANAGYHVPLWPGAFGHVGLAHGVAVPMAEPDVGLPINKRFFPGGENTVRGYTEGAASPRNASGVAIGAESMLLWNLELEQLLTPSIALVGFVDGVGDTAEIQHYPFNEVLWSAGGGLRWNTLVGPIRLEYGRNLTPRPGDPAGTLHVSLGFPF